ncbi:hypothetical protein BGZ46_008041 [Entomortierella lignicola]|nr:hypothetical protein BGZ46_008041 [Entomortierella lignicola]
MDPQEKLEAMFCPRLDSALVASIYNDTGDFKTALSILGALAASTPITTDTNSTLDSAGQMSNTTNKIHSQKATTNTTKQKKADSASNNQNILIWSEQVASSNTTTSPRSNGYKQGLISNYSSFQQPSPLTARLGTVAQPAGSGVSTASQKNVRAGRNPKYLKKFGFEDDDEQESLNGGSQDGEWNGGDQGADQFQSAQEFLTSQPDSQQQDDQPEIKSKSRRRVKKTKPRPSAPLPETSSSTFATSLPGKLKKEIPEVPVSDQLSTPSTSLLNKSKYKIPKAQISDQHSTPSSTSTPKKLKSKTLKAQVSNQPSGLHIFGEHPTTVKNVDGSQHSELHISYESPTTEENVVGNQHPVSLIPEEPIAKEILAKDQDSTQSDLKEDLAAEENTIRNLDSGSHTPDKHLIADKTMVESQRSEFSNLDKPSSAEGGVLKDQSLGPHNSDEHSMTEGNTVEEQSSDSGPHISDEHSILKEAVDEFQFSDSDMFSECLSSEEHTHLDDDSDDDEFYSFENDYPQDTASLVTGLAESINLAGSVMLTESEEFVESAKLAESALSTNSKMLEESGVPTEAALIPESGSVELAESEILAEPMVLTESVQKEPQTPEEPVIPTKSEGSLGFEALIEPEELPEPEAPVESVSLPESKALAESEAPAEALALAESEAFAKALALAESEALAQELAESEALASEALAESEALSKSVKASAHGRESIKSEELEFLKNCFPDAEHSDEYLAQVLKDSNRDIEKAVEIILSQMFLDNEQIETSSAESGSLNSSELQSISSTSSTGALDDAFFMGVQKSKKKRRSGGNESAGWTNRHVQTPWSIPADALSKTIDGQDGFLIPENNDWATFEHQVSLLMSIFNTVSRATIVSEYHANATDLLRTVESLEKRLQQENRHRPGGKQSEFDRNLAQLIEMFPNHGAIGLKRILVYNGGNIQDAMNAALAADIADGDQPEKHSSTTPKRGTVVSIQAAVNFPQKSQVSVSASNANRLKSLPSTSNPYPGGPRPFPNTLLDNMNMELYNDEDDPVLCRQRANEKLEQRNELFRKAAQAHKSSKGKGNGMSGIAAFYAEEGRKLDAQGKQWQMRAARAVVQHHRLENNDPNLVDLHGLTVTEAHTVVKEAVTQWFSRSTMQASRVKAKPLKIVCGVGSHSKDRIARLYPSVLSLLTKDGWQCEAGNGVILVKGVARHSTTISSGKR